MANDWIIDVLADLKAYAKTNGLPALAGELDDAILLAATEIASTEGKAPAGSVAWNAGKAGSIYRDYAAGSDA